MHNITMLTRLSAAAGAVAMAAAVAATAAPAQAATREGGGIAWPSPTCELAVRNATDGPIDVLVETDIHEHPGMVLKDYQEPLVEYNGAYTRQNLLGRVATMPDDMSSLRVQPGDVASYAIACSEKQLPVGFTMVLASDGDGDRLAEFYNIYWPGHAHTDEGHRLLTVK